MSMYTRNIRIDVTPGAEPKVIHVSQYDKNSRTYAAMNGDMDFDAGKVLAGTCTPQELMLELKHMVCSVAAGAMSKSESLGHKEYFIPYKYQDKTVGPAPCRA